MKQMQQVTPYGGDPPQLFRRATNQKRKPVQSTAAILAQGVTLSQVQQAVKRLRPLIERGD
ncbi:MAG TPA: hypothetical protein VGK74_11495 [Symbiobacteriaceae bacterium]